MQQNILILLQIIVAAGILNVWLLRFQKATPYRGKDAQNLVEEFAAYGLPPLMVWVVGGLKVASAIALLVGFVYPPILFPAATTIAVLMLGALAMHAKVGDAPKKYLPAALMLLCSGTIALLSC